MRPAVHNRSKSYAMLVLVAISMLSFTIVTYAQQPTVLKVMLQDFHETEPREAIEKVLVPNFEKLHPGVKVEVSWTAWDTYVSTYVTLHLGGVLPDVVSVGSSALGQFAKQGIIRPLDIYMRNWRDLKDFIPAAVQDAQINGTYWAVPYKLDVRTLAYNRTYFDEAGLNRDMPPKSWDQLESYAKKLTKTDANGKITRQGFDVRADIQHVLPFVFQAGGHYMSADGSRTLLAENEAVEAVTFLHKLIYEAKASLPTANSLVKGAVAMLHEGSWLMQDAYSNVDIGIADPMAYRKQATHVHINRFGIANTSKNPDLAWEFIAFVMKPENLQSISAPTRAIPSRISVLRMAPYSQDARWNNWFNAAMIAEPVPGFVPELADIVSRYNRALTDIFNNKAPVRSRLEAMAEDVNKNVLNQK